MLSRTPCGVVGPSLGKCKDWTLLSKVVVPASVTAPPLMKTNPRYILEHLPSLLNQKHSKAAWGPNSVSFLSLSWFMATSTWGWCASSVFGLPEPQSSVHCVDRGPPPHNTECPLGITICFFLFFWFYYYFFNWIFVVFLCSKEENNPLFCFIIFE